MKEIYQQTVEEVLERVNGKKSGLTSEQVKRSREKCGWNELTEGKKKGILQIFFEGAVYFPTAPFLVFIRLIQSDKAGTISYSEWKSNQDTQSFNENIEKEYQKLLETLSPEQEKVLTKYCDEIFASGAETEEFFYRLGIKDGLRLKSMVKSVLEMMS